MALAGTACNGRIGAPDPASAQGSKILGLWKVLFYVAAALGALVLGLIAWCLVRYRARPDAPDGEAEGRAENIPLELFYTAVPLLIVAVIFVLALGVQQKVTGLTQDPDVRIEVTGFQWGWRFRYLTEGITIVGTSTQPPRMVLPVHATSRLVLVSPDVIHSFYVPDFLEKKDLIPGVENRMDVTPSRTGHFGGACAEFCGLDHARMTFVVDVVEPQEFQAFVARQKAQQEQQGTTPPGTQGGANEPGGQAAPAAPASARNPGAPSGVTVG